MSKNLVIVESPAKAKTISKYLGKDFDVMASYGHVRDLVPKEGAVDPADGFAMKYQVIERNEKHVKSITNSWSLLKLMSIESVMPSNHLILCCPLLLLPSIFPSIRVFSSESALCIRWPKCWSFSISPSNEYSRLISFRIDLFDLLTVQGTLKSLL